MEQPKVERVLRLMRLMSGNSIYTVEELASRRYTEMRGSYQMLIDLKNKELDSIRIPYQLFTLFDLDNEKVDRFVQDFIKYGTTEPVPDEERQFLQPITPPRYRIWANRSKCWQCPKCGHKMIRISQFGIMVD